MKTITISDEVYTKLSLLKGDKSFSEIINELITRDVEKRIEKILELARERRENIDELEEIIREIRKGFEVRI